MPDYAIGDIQGCYEPLQRLLDHIQFDDKADCLWFVGDLVCRGSQSLEVLRFIKSLPIPPKISLGNHDLALLRLLYCRPLADCFHESLNQILNAEDSEELAFWLRHQGLLHYSETLNVVMSHAGIAPVWDLNEAINYAKELETVLTGEDYKEYLTHCFGNQPACWSKTLSGIERLKAITNYFTRMRFCDDKGCLFLDYKGPVSNSPSNYIPWYEVPNRKPIKASIVFGHWASLNNIYPSSNVYAIDTGCVWGETLTALRLQDKRLFSVPNRVK